MKSAGVDGLTAATDPNTAFSLITALRQAGANVKVAILATGYGGDLLQAGPGALNEAQNVYFSLGFEPIEMQTAATKQFASDLKAAGVKGQATSAQYNGYTSIGLLVRALKANGGSTNSSALISTLSNIHDWDGLGLFGSHKLDLSVRTNVVSGVDNCLWVTKLEGSKFTLGERSRSDLRQDAAGSHGLAVVLTVRTNCSPLPLHTPGRIARSAERCDGQRERQLQGVDQTRRAPHTRPGSHSRCAWSWRACRRRWRSRESRR